LAHGGAISGIPALSTVSIDSGLSAIIDDWPTLPEAIRAGILTIVRMANG
jgi:hypothetical protein